MRVRDALSTDPDVTIAPSGVRTRYLLVGLSCAALHNAIVIGLDRVGIHYVGSSVVSFVIVVVVGYLLHTAFTFQAPRSLPSFARYAVAMAANYPLVVALLFLMVTLAGMPVPIAAPAGTLILFGWNFVTSKWAIARRKGGAPALESGTERTEHNDPSTERVAEVLGEHIALYRRRRPVYQAVLLQSLREAWAPDDRNVLDVGGGTGVIAQAIHDLFPVDRIVSVDVEDRFLPTLSIETATYDGLSLPFPDASFDCVLISNVLHHVPAKWRPALIRECSRVTGAGRLYIKDHLAANAFDRVRLAMLDLIGNAPFHGMVRATYLGADDWAALAAAAGYRVEQEVSGDYRAGLLSWLFPNRLEITMRWVKLD
jgi:putative flippase GtrA/SAM-dependent methyltransferase